ncbi:hypothetical protein ABEB36_005840 [Hypothenemus hampei]|uniref:Uncharacterized protein n=1 Tax=Hypothenemus hampei TaxID=57062 RepID=A0ABD1F286_HYPHA
MNTESRENIHADDIVIPANTEIPELTITASNNSETNFIVHQNSSVLSQFLHSAANRLNEDFINKIHYACLLLLCVLTVLIYIYIQPSMGTRIKWRRSIRKIKRFSKPLLPKFQVSKSGLYPFAKEMVHVAHVILTSWFE